MPLTNEIKSFKRKNHGEVIYIAVGLCLFAAGFLLIFQKDVSEALIEIGSRYFFLIVGIGLGLGYYFNKRSSFRPSWTLPLGILFSVISAGYIISSFIEKLSTPGISLALIILTCSLYNGSVLLACGIQYYSLTLKRRYFLYVFSGSFFVFSVLGYLNAFELRENNLLSLSIFCLILGTATLFEGIYDFANTYRRKNQNLV